PYFCLPCPLSYFIVVFFFILSLPCNSCLTGTSRNMLPPALDQKSLWYSVLHAPYNADKPPNWVLGALPYGVLYPRVCDNGASPVLQGTSLHAKSVNLISEQ